MVSIIKILWIYGKSKIIMGIIYVRNGNLKTKERIRREGKRRIKEKEIRSVTKKSKISYQNEKTRRRQKVKRRIKKVRRIL